MSVSDVSKEVGIALSDWGVQSWAYKLPEKYDLEQNLPAAKTTKVNDVSSFFAGDILQTTVARYQIQIYLDIDKHDFEIISNKLIESLEVKEILFVWRNETLHETKNNILIGTYQFVKTNYKGAI